MNITGICKINRIYRDDNFNQTYAFLKYIQTCLKVYEKVVLGGIQLKLSEVLGNNIAGWAAQHDFLCSLK